MSVVLPIGQAGLFFLSVSLDSLLLDSNVKPDDLVPEPSVEETEICQDNIVSEDNSSFVTAGGISHLNNQRVRNRCDSVHRVQNSQTLFAASYIAGRSG